MLCDTLLNYSFINEVQEILLYFGKKLKVISNLFFFNILNLIYFFFLSQNITFAMKKKSEYLKMKFKKKKTIFMYLYFFIIISFS